MKHIFISYDPKDGDFAETLRREINEAGFATWMERDRQFVSMDWPEGVDQAIREASALIVIMTPAAKVSESVTYEWAFALGVGVKVITLLLEPTTLPTRLDALQRVDFTAHPAPWRTLFEVLQETTGSLIPQAANLLGDAPLAVKQMVAALNSTSLADREAAVESLAEIDHPAAREALAGATRHPLRDVRIHAAFMLAQFKDARAVPGLLEATHDMDPDHRVGKAVVKALRQITPYGSPGEAATVGLAAGWALRRMGGDAVPGLLDVLRSAERHVRLDAIEWLGETGEASAVPGLLNALNDEDWRVRMGSAEALGKIGDKSAVPGLLEILLDSNDQVRRVTAEALGRIRDAAAVPALVNALRDENSEVRRAVAWALTHIGTPGALAALKKRRQR